MAETSKPVAKNTTPQSNFILKTLQSHGVWMTRTEIATKIGKKVLNKWDMALLDLLISQRLVEVEKQKFQGGIGFAWMYRATAKEGSA